MITSVDAKLSSGYCLTAEPDPIVSRRNRTKSARLCYEYAGEGDGEQRLQEKRWEVVRNGGQKGEACSPVLSNRSGRRQCKKHRGRTMLTFFCNGKRSSLIVNDRQPSVSQPQAYSYIRVLHLCLVCALLLSFCLHHPHPRPCSSRCSESFSLNSEDTTAGSKPHQLLSVLAFARDSTALPCSNTIVKMTYFYHF